MIFAHLFLLVIYISLGIACVVYVLWTLSWMPSRKGHVPYTPTNSQIMPYIVSALDLKPHSVLYDLGCGDGKVIFACYKAHPDVKYIGIEFHIFPYLIACMRHLFLGRPKNITFIYGDLFRSNLSGATHIYMFLSTRMVNILLPWLEKNVKKGTRVVSSNFTFTTKEPLESIEPQGLKGSFVKGLYIYEF